MRSFAASVFATLLVVSCAQAEDVELPTFTSWAKRPVGTTIKYQTILENPTSKVTVTNSYKLLDVRMDRVYLETVRSSDATGPLVVNSPEKLEIKRRFPLFPGVKKEHVTGVPKEAVAKGEETIKVLGKDVKTFWYDIKGRGDAGPTTTRTWMSDEIPNRVVKSTIDIPEAKTMVTQTIVELTIPKE